MKAPEGPARRHRLFDFLPVAVPGFWAVFGPDLLPDDLFGRQIEPAGRLRDIDDSVLGIRLPETIDTGAGEIAKSLFARQQFGLSLLDVRDVRTNADDFAVLGAIFR